MFKTIFSPLFDKKAIALETRYSLNKCNEKLKHHTTWIPFDFRKHKYFFGLVSSNRVYVVYYTSWFSNAMRPTLYARLNNIDGKSQLNGSFQMGILPKIFMIFWLLAAFGMSIICLPVIIHEPAAFLVFLFPLAGILFLKMGKLFCKEEDEKTLRHLIKILKAKEIDKSSTSNP